jgi:hypothetical protein
MLTPTWLVGLIPCAGHGSSEVRLSFRRVEQRDFRIMSLELCSWYINRPRGNPSVATNPIVCGPSVFVRNPPVSVDRSISRIVRASQSRQSLLSSDLNTDSDLSPQSESRDTSPTDSDHRDSSRCLARALAPQVCDTHLLRARHDSLGDSTPS